MSSSRLTVSLLALLLLSCSGCAVERHAEWHRAVVGEAAYTPSSTVTGVGPALTGRGGVVLTVSSVPATYVVTFYCDDGSKQSVNSYDWWRACNIGDSVRVLYTWWRVKPSRAWEWGGLDSLRVYR